MIDINYIDACTGFFFIKQEKNIFIVIISNNLYLFSKKKYIYILHCCIRKVAVYFDYLS